MTYKEVLERVIADDKYRLFVTAKEQYVEMKFLIPEEYYEKLIKDESGDKECVK